MVIYLVLVAFVCRPTRSKHLAKPSKLTRNQTWYRTNNQPSSAYLCDYMCIQPPPTSCTYISNTTFNVVDGNRLHCVNPQFSVKANPWRPPALSTNLLPYKYPYPPANQQLLLLPHTSTSWKPSYPNTRYCMPSKVPSKHEREESIEGKPDDDKYLPQWLSPLIPLPKLLLIHGGSCTR